MSKLTDIEDRAFKARLRLGIPAKKRVPRMVHGLNRRDRTNKSGYYDPRGFTVMFEFGGCDEKEVDYEIPANDGNG